MATSSGSAWSQHRQPDLDARDLLDDRAESVAEVVQRRPLNLLWPGPGLAPRDPIHVRRRALDENEDEPLVAEDFDRVRPSAQRVLISPPTRCERGWAN